MDPISSAFAKIIGTMLSAIIGAITPPPSPPSKPAHAARTIAPEAPTAPHDRSLRTPTRSNTNSPSR